MFLQQSFGIKGRKADVSATESYNTTENYDTATSQIVYAIIVGGKGPNTIYLTLCDGDYSWLVCFHFAIILNALSSQKQPITVHDWRENYNNVFWIMLETEFGCYEEILKIDLE